MNIVKGALLSVVVVTCLALGGNAAYGAWEAHQLAGQCAALQACPTSLQSEIAQTTGVAIASALLSLGLLIAVLYISLRPRAGDPALGEWDGPTSPKALSAVLDELGTPGPNKKSRRSVEVIISQLERTVDSQTADFEGLVTRSSIILGFVSVLIGAELAVLLPVGTLVTSWIYAALAVLLISASLLLACILSGWGRREVPTHWLVREAETNPDHLRVATAKSLVQVAATGNRSLATLRGSFYVGVAAWAIGLLLLGLSWFLR